MREAPPQFGLAEQEQAEAVLGVHLVVGEQAEVLEDVGAQVVRFVDDEDGSACARRRTRRETSVLICR